MKSSKKNNPIESGVMWAVDLISAGDTGGAIFAAHQPLREFISLDDFIKRVARRLGVSASSLSGLEI